MWSRRKPERPGTKVLQQVSAAMGRTFGPGSGILQAKRVVQRNCTMSEESLLFLSFLLFVMWGINMVIFCVGAQMFVNVYFITSLPYGLTTEPIRREVEAESPLKRADLSHSVERGQEGHKLVVRLCQQSREKDA